MIRNGPLLVLFMLTILSSCSTESAKLPILGRYTVEVREVGGKEVNDTIFHTIQPFRFIDQDRVYVTNETFEDKIYVSDFFFTSCPSICPIMKTQMLRVYDEYVDNPDILFLSHTIDPKHDTVEVLHEFAKGLGVNSNKWHFVTGDKQEIYELAQVSYMSVAAEDNEAEGGYVHSGRFLLVDQERRIRGAYDGTDPVDVDKLIRDIKVLLVENDS